MTVIELLEHILDKGYSIDIYANEGIAVHVAGRTQEEPKPEQKPKPKKAVNRKELDMGKVKALREAGWSLEKIADEMGCAAQTIANHLKEVES